MALRKSIEHKENVNWPKISIFNWSLVTAYAQNIFIAWRDRVYNVALKRPQAIAAIGRPFWLFFIAFPAVKKGKIWVKQQINLDTPDVVVVVVVIVNAHTHIHTCTFSLTGVNCIRITMLLRMYLLDTFSSRALANFIYGQFM